MSFFRKIAPAIAMVVAIAIAGCSSTDEAAKEPVPTAQPSGKRPSAKEAAEKMVRCLSDKGWDVAVGEDGEGFEARYPTDQTSRYDADREACLQELGLDIPLPPLTQEEAEHVYEVYLKAAECVRGLGYEVSEPPSRQAFVEETIRRRISAWHPYSDVMESDPGRLGQLESQCPIDLPY